MPVRPARVFKKPKCPGTTDSHIVTAPQAIDIYPNPFTDKVVIAGNFTGYEIKVFDSIGQEVADYTGSSSPLTIDLNGLGAGLYFVSVQHTGLSSLSVL